MSLKLTVTLLTIATCFTQCASAHPVSLSRSFVYVTRDRISVKIEAYLEDLVLFHDVKPNDQDFLEPDVISTGIGKHQSFLLKKFLIRDLEGRAIAGREIDVDRSHLPAEGVGIGDLMAHKLVYEFEYELPVEPEFLTFSQHLVDSEGSVPAEMQLLVQQENAAEPRTTTLMPDEPETYRFDWTAPPLGAEASNEAWKKWNEKQKEETLGITSYSSVYSFLYVEENEVRHEILVPLLSLEESILIARDDDSFLDLSEQAAARQQVEAFFVSGNPIEIDGQLVKPTVARCDFFGLDFKDFAKRAEPRDVSIANARIGIILSYAAQAPPTDVRLTWNRFNNYIRNINLVAFAGEDAAKTKLSRIKNQSTYQWQGDRTTKVAPPQQVKVKLPPRAIWSVPIVSAVFFMLLIPIAMVLRVRKSSGTSQFLTVAVFGVVVVATLPFSRVNVASPFARSPEVKNDAASKIFEDLHANTYRAFQFHGESKIYDALAVSVDGDLLDQLYLQIRRGLQMQEQGGAISRIRDVAITEGRKENPAAPSQDERSFGYHCRWSVSGTVEHWGHIHSRTNEYVARFTVEPRGGVWKITQVDLLDEKRLKTQTSLRGL